MFPLWVAVLGLSFYTLVGGLTSLDSDRIAGQFTSNRAVVTGAAWTRLVVAGLFGLLWLSEDVPALLNGVRPQSVVDMPLPTNPVHVLDYAFFLPAALGAGIRQLQRRAFAYPIRAAFLVFLLLTCIPILITPFVQTALHERAAWGIMIPIGIVAAVILGMLVWLLVTVRALRTPMAR